MIERPFYLEALKNRMWNDSIKVITGIRRCGKSYLMNILFKDYLLSSGIPEKNIIRFSFESAIDLSKIGEDPVKMRKEKRKADYSKFIQYIETLVSEGEQYYLLLDEVQLLDSFEYVLNGYLTLGNYDIYVTGSNSKFLSSDVITEFRGRGDEIHVLPLSFSEFYGYVKGNIDNRIDEYMTFGGLPRTVLAKTNEAKIKYLNEQLENTYLRDVIDRNKIKRTEELNELVLILASGISSLTNPLKLEKSFQSLKKKQLTADTISKYIENLQEAFIISKILKYNVKGKAYISTPYKIYFEDCGLRNAKLNFRQVEYTHLMENVIYNELRYRGYNVDTGEVDTREQNIRKQLEVDFIANNGSNRYYIQSVFDIPDEKKLSQETKSFDNISDSFKKIIIVGKDIVPKHNDSGYLFISLKDFLLNTNSLEW